ncbi:MAG: type II toxin-antitoxin system HicB family antitoxin [Deltaproteobacteria bacterium]|nr:type II toxin-antitoxin system HicB family antitoxin [Deltaproteobacteria bacterium]
MPNYIAVVHKEPTSDYGVSFPDFAGCITAGKTIDEAKDMAYEALLLHLEGLREDGEPLPAPTNLEDIVADPENADAVAFLVVSVPDAQGKAKRINITIPEETLRRVDAAAKRRGLSRSSFLTRAAQEVMEQEGRTPAA